METFHKLDRYLLSNMWSKLEKFGHKLDRGQIQQATKIR